MTIPASIWIAQHGGQWVRPEPSEREPREITPTPTLLDCSGCNHLIPPAGPCAKLLGEAGQPCWSKWNRVRAAGACVFMPASNNTP